VEAGIEPLVGSLATVITTHWRTIEVAKFAALGWGYWSNRNRLLELIGNMLSAGIEEQYYAMPDELAVAA
jgi:hypothetical protein